MGRKRRRETREAPDMAAFVGRVARGMVRRAAEGDLETLGALANMARDIDKALALAASSLVLEAGYSWTEVGRELGITRQAAWQRFGRPLTGEERPS